MIPPIVLIIAVLGSILAGVATPTEAAAVGAVGAVVLAGMRLEEKNARPIYIAGLSLVVMLVSANTLDLRVARDHIRRARDGGWRAWAHRSAPGHSKW